MSENPEQRFSYEDFELIELFEQVRFERGDEARAAPDAEVQRGDQDHFVIVKVLFALPNAFQGKLAAVAMSSRQNAPSNFFSTAANFWWAMGRPLLKYKGR